MWLVNGIVSFVCLVLLGSKYRFGGYLIFKK